MPFTIEPFTTAPTAADLDDLAAIVCDAVASGASVGFMPPVDASRYAGYWREVIAELTTGTRLMLVARVGGRIVGTAQLALAIRENSLHRGEVQKVLVHRAHRCQGIATALMQALEDAAHARGRSCLYLETGASGNAHGLYQRCGYTRVGTIPRFALNPDGSFCDTVFYYKLLEPPAAATTEKLNG
ncbi:MAG: GNAT family N-acetyltransferase [Verrucomicrobia bacterium]|nr:GNAT family N-acetyltransferase [Verrucomicrobiota bacterium]